MTLLREISEPIAFRWSLVFAALLTCCLLLLSIQPRQKAPVVFFVSPFATELTVLEVAAGARTRLLAVAGPSWAMIVYDAEPGLSDRLYRSGAWLVLDPALIVACLGIANLGGQKRWDQRG